MNVKSQARINYSYSLDGVNMRNSTQSNIVNTFIRKLGLCAKKFSNSEFYKNSDVMSFSIVVNNTGNYVTNNVVITDKFSDMNILTDSIKGIFLENDSFESLDYTVNDEGIIFNIAKLPAHSVYVISYKTMVDSSNSSIKTQMFIKSDEISEISSKPFNLKLGFAEIECLKKVNDNVTFVDSYLTYELIIRNRGNINAYNVEVYDELPSTYRLDDSNPVTIDGNNIDYKFENNILSFVINECKPGEEIHIFINGQITC